MMDVNIRSVAQEDLFAAAEAHPESVLLCAFDLPLSPQELADITCRLSSTRTPVDVADIRSVAYDAAAAPTSTALSLHGLDPHTDGSFLPEPPARIILSCTTSDAHGGGATTLIPIDFVLDSAPGWVLTGLERARYQFLKSYDGDLTDSVVAPVLTRAEDGRPRIRWRADDIYVPRAVDPAGRRADDAAEWLHTLLATADAYRHVLQPGELILVPNHLVVHGRDPLSLDSGREVSRAWVF